MESVTIKQEDFNRLVLSALKAKKYKKLYLDNIEKKTTSLKEEREKLCKKYKKKEEKKSSFIKSSDKYKDYYIYCSWFCPYENCKFKINQDTLVVKCSNDCGTVFCPECSREFYDYSKIGHSPSCGDLTIEKINDDPEPYTELDPKHKFNFDYLNDVVPV